MDIRTSKCPCFCHVATGSAAFVAASQSGHSATGNVGDTAAANAAADAQIAKTEKTAVSISEALTGDFERIFYVDVLTDFYLEFVTGEDGKLEIHPGGIDFFDSARKNLLQDVAEDDAGSLREATGKANLIRLAEQNESVTLPFRRMKNGVPTPYTLQTIRTRESDRHHIVIGVKKEETAPKS